MLEKLKGSRRSLPTVCDFHGTLKIQPSLSCLLDAAASNPSLIIGKPGEDDRTRRVHEGPQHRFADVLASPCVISVPAGLQSQFDKAFSLTMPSGAE